MSAAVLQFILLAIQALPSIIEAGGELATEAANLAAMIKTFQTENRDPTAGEWASANASLVSALNNLNGQKQALAARLATTADGVKRPAVI